MKGSSLTLHPEEEQLLRYLDGELPAQATGEVRSHLEACWQCRAALEELQDVVSQCVHYRKNVLQRHLPAPPAPWVDIYRQFDRIDASMEPVFFDRVARALKSPFDTTAKKWALAAAALLVLLGLFYRYQRTPSVQAAELLRRADAIFIDELRAADWYGKVAQAFAVFLPVRSVGVMGDGRTYEYVVALRAVQTTDFMTAHWAELPYDILGRVSSRIINEVRGINRVTYDISAKPPATIEWE